MQQVVNVLKNAVDVRRAKLRRIAFLLTFASKANPILRHHSCF